MSLTPQEIQNYRSQFNITPPATPAPTVNGVRGNDRMNMFFGGDKTPQETAAPVEPNPAEPSLSKNIQDTGNEFTSTVGGFVDSTKNRMSQIAQDTTDIATGKADGISPATKAVRTAGNVVGIAGDAIGTGIKAITDAIAPQSVKDGAKAALADIAQMTNAHEIADKYNQLKTDHPQAAELLDGSIDIGKFLLNFVGLPKGIKALDAGVGPTIDNAAKEGSNIVSDVKQGVSSMMPEAKPVISKVFPKEKIDNIVGKIIQGKPEDIAAGKRALTEINPEGIKTQSDLYNALDNRVKSLSKSLDTELSNSPVHSKPLLLEQWDKSIKVGEKMVSHNYVDDALSQLKDYYSKTNDVINTTKINNIIEKANSEGLTIKDVNDIAKEHGNTLNAFNANGELASGLTKKAAENTRIGLKESAREAYGNESYKAVDSAISDTIKTRDLVKEQVDAVNKLQQKIKERTFGEKVGHLAGQVINLVGLNSPKGLIEYFLGRGTGLKTLNALDIQNMLQTNIKMLQNMVGKDVTENTLVNRMESFLKDNQSRSTQSFPEGKNEATKIINQENIPSIKKNANNSIESNSTTFQPKSKTVQAIMGFAKDPKLGLSVEDITKKIPSELRAEAKDTYSIVKKLTSADFTNKAKVGTKINIGAYGDIDSFMTKFEEDPASITKEDIRNAQEAHRIVKKR